MSSFFMSRSFVISFLIITLLSDSLLKIKAVYADPLVQKITKKPEKISPSLENKSKIYKLEDILKDGVDYTQVVNPYTVQGHKARKRIGAATRNNIAMLDKLLPSPPSSQT